MSTVHRPVWLRSLETHAGLVPCIVVHGEVHDLRRNPWTTEYQRVPPLVAETLREGPFETVIEWDLVTGVSGRDAARWEDLASAVGPAETQGSAYAIAPYEHFDSGPKSTRVTIDDFVAVMLTAMVDGTDRPTAFVVNLANFAFFSGQQPSQAERDILARLAKAIIGRADTEARGTANLLILVSPNAQALPLSMLPGPAHVREVVVPLPDREERLMLLGDRLHGWKLKNQPKPGQVAYEDLVDALDGISFQDLLNIEELSVNPRQPKS